MIAASGVLARFGALIAAGAIAIAAGSASGAGLACKTARITASDSTPFDAFGRGVAVSGDRALIGAYTDGFGSAYVFTLDGSSWIQEQKLLPSDGAGEDYFGHTVAIYGDVAMVASPNHVHGPGFDVGAVYVFVQEDVGWVEHQEVLTSSAELSGPLGYSIALVGDVALIGAPSDSDIGLYAGSAHVFRRDPKTSQWVEQDELHAADGASRDGFGFSVALDLDARTALIGSPGDDDNGSVSGSANVFHFDGSNWVQEQKLLASDGAFQAFFGHSVSLSGDAALIGARGVADGHGAAYVFRFDPVLANWAPEQKLVAADSPTSEQLGFAVALVGDTALVGAPFSWAQAPEHGAAYVFRFDGRLWVEHQLLLPDPNPWTSFFGYSLAMSGDQALIGALGEDAQKGAAYLFAGLRGTDCNANGSADTCDLLLGLGDDSNGNGIPDKCEQCPWDLDGSGVVGITDFLELLAMWGSSPGGPPDFDGDGTVGIVDFLALLANWGPCLKGPQIARPRDHADDR